MLTCIQASITNKCALKVVTSGEIYEIEVKNGDLSEMEPDGPAFLGPTFIRVLIS